MKLIAVTGALGALVLAAAGCSEDVGDCYEGDMKGGYDTVVVGTHIEYGGQAIINQACATGCHQSGVKGAGRKGAPAGLDFDLRPVNAESEGLEGAQTDKGRTYAVLAQDDVNGLRERQRRVFSMRNSIWQQVRDGLMPPEGVGEVFRAAVKMIFDTEEASPCTAGTAFKDMDSKDTQDVLRNWLACQAPIVESYGGPVDANRVAGKAGYQYLACGDDLPPPSDGGVPADGSVAIPISLEDLMATRGVLSVTNCTLCHPALARDYPLDLTSVDKAYETLLDPAEKCDGKPYVTPGDPDKSFLIDVVTKDDPGCDIERMPQSMDELTTAQVQQLRDWITAGAPRTAALVQSAPLRGGLDAGVP